MAKPRRKLSEAAAPRDMANSPAELEAQVLQQRNEAPKEEPKKQVRQPNRKKLTLDIDEALIREVRVACLELPPKLTGGGPSGFVTRALEAYLEALRGDYNEGQRFESDEDPRIPRGPKRPR